MSFLRGRPKRKDGGHWDNEYPSAGWITHRCKKNLVCFTCRTIRRVELHIGDVKRICQFCQKPMVDMWVKIALPKKTDIKGWRNLETQVRTRRRYQYD